MKLLIKQEKYFKHSYFLKENSLKNVSEVDQYKNLIDQIELINLIIGIIEYFKKYNEILEGFQEIFLLIPKNKKILILIYIEFTNSIDQKNYPKCDELFTVLLKTVNNEDQDTKPVLKSKSNIKETIVLSINEPNTILNDLYVFRLLNEEFTIQKERLWFNKLM